MPAFTYSHRYLQFLTDQLVNLPQYQQQLHWSIGTEITNKGKKLSINFFKKLASLTVHYLRCIWNVLFRCQLSLIRIFSSSLIGWLLCLANWLKSSYFRLSRQRLTCRSLHWSDWAQYCAVCNELLSIFFVFRNINI